MRVIKVSMSAHWVSQDYEEIIEVDDFENDSDVDKTVRDKALEQFEWWWEELKK